MRIHKTLELADDKFYMITCGKAGFQNRNNETSLVTLQLLREDRKVQQVVYGREYTLKYVWQIQDWMFISLCISGPTSPNQTGLSG